VKNSETKKKERKVYPMKFTKFIPLALAMALVSPAFAAATETASSEMVITVPSFINITKSSSVEAASATFDDTYENITLGTAMNATFHVVTNVPTDHVYLTAEAYEDGGLVKCLGGTVDALKIVFTNRGTAGTGTTGSPSGAITNALAVSPVLATNADAIAFTLTPVITNDADSGMSAAPTGVLTSGVVNYTFTKAGNCDFQYTVGTTQVANTFDTHDTAGKYQATLTMSHAAP